MCLLLNLHNFFYASTATDIKLEICHVEGRVVFVNCSLINLVNFRFGIVSIFVGYGYRLRITLSGENR